METIVRCTAGQMTPSKTNRIQGNFIDASWAINVRNFIDLVQSARAKYISKSYKSVTDSLNVSYSMISGGVSFLWSSNDFYASLYPVGLITELLKYHLHDIPCSSYSHAANYTNPRKPRKAIKRQKQRPLFSPEQLKRLEEEFVNEKYISKSRRCKLASEISLTEAQVRTWFQNRRTRWRKEVHEEEEDPSWTTHSGITPQTGVINTNCMIMPAYCKI